MADLSLVETTEMVEELKRRFDACVFVGIKETTSDTEEFNAIYGGSYATCLGLVEHLKNQMMFERLAADAIPYVVEFGDDDDEEELGGEWG